jgi:hypothetical protein
MAVRYYFRDLIRESENGWRGQSFGVSNYTTLLDDIRLHTECCLVTFNYDTMVERALEDLGVLPGSMESYVDSTFPLIKLHGSTNGSSGLR